MEKRHTSRPSRLDRPRPRTVRKRSNSLPIVEALGCSTPEAELIMAEGTAAVRRRQASTHRRGRRNRSFDEPPPFRPKDHLKYLEYTQVELEGKEESVSPGQSSSRRHSRMPSNCTDRSSSTIVAPVQPVVSEACLGDYSANLAKFIQSQLRSIPTYRPMASSFSPRSCPDLTLPSRTPPHSPALSTRRPVEAPKNIEIPPVRPPLRSAFSAWSSTDDDEVEELDDAVPPVPELETMTRVITNTSTPSVSGYYQHSQDASFLFLSTPDEEDRPGTAKATSFPNQSALPGSSSEPNSSVTDDDDYPSSALYTRPQLTCSSAPSFSSASTASYFDCKQPLTLAPHIKDRIIAAVTPPHGQGKMAPAISPLEGNALADVHNLLVDSQQRVHVDGMTFDMLREYASPDERIHRIPTPC